MQPNPTLVQRSGGASRRQVNHAVKIQRAESRPARIRSSAVQRDRETLLVFSTRGDPMTTLSSRAAATAFASLLLIGSAFAQTTPPASPAPAAKAATAEKKAAKPRTAASLECS